MLEQKLESILFMGLKYLKDNILTNKGFSARTFYGESYALLVLEREGQLTHELTEILLTKFWEKDFEDPEFHWEFNNYAFIGLQDNDIRKEVLPLRFKGTSCTNWTLLRNLTKIKHGEDINESKKNCKAIIKKYQKKSGIILDEKDVRSFQYHCFSSALVYELYILTHDEFFLKSFKRAVEFIGPFVLENGDSLYIGRGQLQIFGQATLAYILSQYNLEFRTNKYIDQLDAVLSFLESKQHENGYIPLVLNDCIKEKFPKVVDVTKVGNFGWYPYNNYFDYLPFALYYLSRAKDNLTKNERIKYNDKLSFSDLYEDRDFIKFSNENYCAVLSRPGTRLSNSQPLPYIYSKGKTLTPCFGGEDFQNSIYSHSGIPLPYSKKFKKGLAYRCFSFFYKRHLVVISLMGILIRRYIFEDSRIEVRDITFSWLKLKSIFIIMEEMNEEIIMIKSKKDLKMGDEVYSASGRLRSYLYKGNNKISYELTK